MVLDDRTMVSGDRPVREPGTGVSRPGSLFLPAPKGEDPWPTMPLPVAPQNAAEPGRRSERLTRKRALGRTRGRAAGVRAAGTRTAAALFRQRTLTRRQALGAAAGAAAIGSLSAMALGSTDSPPADVAAGGGTAAGGLSLLTEPDATTVALGTAPTPASLTPVPIARGVTAEHLLGRLTFGATAASRADIASLGMSNWLALQLTPARLADPLGAKVTAMYPALKWSIARMHAQRDQNEKYYELLYQPGLQHIGRAIWSSRQLFEIMVDFWSNHLNVPSPADKGSWARHRYDADVIRKHALGRFETMLLASSTHPAMLAYLDNEKSTKRQPNENYARELMELHTLGVDGGYTEKDVKQLALLLTGWETPWKTGVTRYVPDRHYGKPVTVLGRRIANGTGDAGLRAQQGFVRSLASHPATARHICRKLAIRFVSDTPSTALVDSLAKVYLANRTAVVPVLKAIFASPEFAAAEGLKVRRPLERVIAVVRALGPRFTGDHEGLQQLYWMTKNTGQQPLAWPTPDGYADTAEKWQSPAAALELINSTTSLVYGWWPDRLGLPGGERLLPKPPSNRAAMLDAISRKVLGRSPTGRERTALNQLLAGTHLPTSFGDQKWARTSTGALAAIVLMTSPDFLSR